MTAQKIIYFGSRAKTQQKRAASARSKLQSPSENLEFEWRPKDYRMIIGDKSDKIVTQIHNLSPTSDDNMDWLILTFNS